MAEGFTDAPRRLRIASHLGGSDALGLPAELADRVEVVPVSMRGPAPEGLRAEVLVSVPEWPENTAEILAGGVRWLHFVTTGIDRVDFATLPEGLVVTNSRGASAVPISEWVLAVMLAFEKHLPEMWIHDPPADWRADARLGSLQGRRLAIVGFGSIGAAVAERARPFGVEIRALRRTDTPSPVAGVEMVGTLAEVLDGADHVVLAAPLDRGHPPPRRRPCLRRDEAGGPPGQHRPWRAGRPGRAARGSRRRHGRDGVARRGRSRAASAGHWLFDHPRVRLSAHDSWSWPDAFATMFERFVVNLAAYLDGRPLPDLVDPTMGY